MGGGLGRGSWMLLEILLRVATVVLDQDPLILLSYDQTGHELHFASHMIIRGLDRVSNEQEAISILGKVAERRMVPHFAEKSG